MITKILKFGLSFCYFFILLAFSFCLATRNDGILSYDLQSSNQTLISSLSHNVTVSVGKTAILKCEASTPDNKIIVSWRRHGKFQVLTVGTFTYSKDKRFQSIYLPDSNKWALQIQYPEVSDSGMYECQTNAYPSKRHFVSLFVVAPKIQILGAPALFIRQRSTINLTCVITHSPKSRGHEIKWTFNNRTINGVTPREGINLFTKIEEDMISSNLLVLNARMEDSGIYVCSQTEVMTQQIFVKVERNGGLENGVFKSRPRLELWVASLLLYFVMLPVE